MMMLEKPSLVAPPLEDRLDLHRFQPRQAATLVDDYLRAAAAAGYSEVLIIHGKGRGVLKHRVQGLLTRHPLAACFRDAPPELGGWGATLVVLATSSEQPTAAESAPSTRGAEPQGTPRWSHPARFLLGLLLGLAATALLLHFIR